MKSLKDIISEKLIINKDSKNKKEYSIKDLLLYLNITEKTCERYEYLSTKMTDWVNNINNCQLEPCADPATLNESPFLDNFKKLYNTGLTVNEWCQEQLSKAHHIYSHQDDINLYYTDNMICNITSFGTLYIINKDYYNHHEKY